MRVTATAKYIRISPRKVRLVTDLIAGKPVEEAAAILRFLPNAAARDVAKLLKSAPANAENNYNLSADELHVVSAVADEGPTLKRWRPRAQGRTFGILKRTSHITVTVHTAKPGIVIGKGGANVEALRTNIGKLTNKKVKLEIKEILQPELDGMLLAQNVAGQLERRIAVRQAVKQSIQRTIKAGAKGVKIQVSGRLGGSEMSRTEWDKEGRIPLGTLRADISYGMVHAHTTYGRIGVKVWIYRGEQLGERPGSARTEPREPRARTPRARATTPATGSRVRRTAEPAAAA